MRLTLHTDYALRALIYLAETGDKGATAGSMADAYRISKNHLVKVLQRLRDLGYIETLRGRGGGVRLAKAPDQITLGGVVRQTEDNLNLVECFDPATNTCPLISACGLKGRLAEALGAYLAVLDRYTIADVAGDRRVLGMLLGQDAS